jgi:hypothetical protein
MISGSKPPCYGPQNAGHPGETNDIGKKAPPLFDHFHALECERESKNLSSGSELLECGIYPVVGRHDQTKITNHHGYEYYRGPSDCSPRRHSNSLMQ